jgi:hypothetical protein
MKFWELISAFRTETDNLKKIFAKDCWKKYRLQHENLETIISKQDRKILDEEVPLQLAKEVCEISKLEFYLYYKDKPHRLTTWKQDRNEEFEVVTPSDILFRFGGKFIEETLERSFSEVIPKQIGEDVEVLGVFKLTNVGMMAFLRTENRQLVKNELLCSLDGQRKWTVLDEPFMILEPSSAHEKREHQIKQGIRFYKILPHNGSGKPKETEILNIKSKQKT